MGLQEMPKSVYTFFLAKFSHNLAIFFAKWLILKKGFLVARFNEIFKEIARV
jgi:hypothetical protein